MHHRVRTPSDHQQKPLASCQKPRAAPTKTKTRCKAVMQHCQQCSRCGTRRAPNLMVTSGHCNTGGPEAAGAPCVAAVPAMQPVCCHRGLVKSKGKQQQAHPYSRLLTPEGCQTGCKLSTDPVGALSRLCAVVLLFGVDGTLSLRD